MLDGWPDVLSWNGSRRWRERRGWPDVAWIELHQSVVNHRKTLALADALDIRPVEALGHMASLWLWSLDNAPDGDISGITERTLSRAAQWDGEPATFRAALIAAGFLHEDGIVHDWHDYAGKLIDRRRENAARMREKRERNDARVDTPSVSVAERVTNVQRTTSARAPATVPNPTVPNHSSPNGEGAPDKPTPLPPKAREPEKHPACRAYRRLTNSVPKPVHRALIEKEIASDADADTLGKWEAAVTAWVGRGYRKENVAGMLEWFKDGVPPQKHQGGPAAAVTNGRVTVADIAGARIRAIDAARENGQANGLSAIPDRHGAAHSQLPAPRIIG